MLPTFLVIGAYKSGTTSLYRYLAQHPQIFLPRMKEPSYFAFAGAGIEGASLVYRRSIKTIAEYEGLFDEATGYTAIGDVSPEYMTSPVAARAIRTHVPTARLIAILRNPVDRAYSDYLMYRRDGTEGNTEFGEALKHQAARASMGDPTGNYISSGLYGEQLERYYKLFPREQIKIISMDRLQSDGPQTLSQIFRFLGVNEHFIPKDLAIYNRSGVTSNYLVSKLFQYRRFVSPLMRRLLSENLRILIRHKFESSLERPPLNPAVKRSLVEAFRNDVLLLEQLTGQSFRNWQD
jgi:hypothetical protein